jgi:hypothetical protein
VNVAGAEELRPARQTLPPVLKVRKKAETESGTSGQRAGQLCQSEHIIGTILLARGRVGVRQNAPV